MQTWSTVPWKTSHRDTWETNERDRTSMTQGPRPVVTPKTCLLDQVPTLGDLEELGMWNPEVLC